MKKLSVIFCLVCVVASNCFAIYPTNVWSRIWGSTEEDSAKAVSVDSAGNIYVAGYTYGSFDGQSNNGNGDLCLTKYNSNGSSLWTRIWGTSYTDEANGICVDNIGNVYIAGTINGATGGGTWALSELYLIKYNSSGTKQWTQIWGSDKYDIANGVSLDSAGNIYVVGTTDGSFDGQTNNGDYDLCLTKFNSSGTKQWARIWGTSSHDSGNGVSVDSAGNVYVAGISLNIFNYSYLCLTKYNSSGTKQWMQTWGSSKNDLGYDVSVDRDDNIYVTGNAGGSFDGQSNNGDYDLFLTKFNSSGTKQWTRIWGSDESDGGYGVIVDGNNNVYVAGHTGGSFDGQSHNGERDLCLTKFNSNGTKQWTRIWGSSIDDFGRSVCVDSTGNIYVAGSTEGAFDGQSNNGNYDIFLTKINDRPIINITNSIKITQKEERIDGENYDIIGKMGLSNSLNEGIVWFSEFPIIVSNLQYGFNNITIFGTNLFNCNANDSIDILRVESASPPPIESWIKSLESYTGSDLIVNNTNIYVVGSYDNDLCLIKYNNYGSIIWTKLWGSPNNDVGKGVSVDSSGNIYVAGYTSGSFDGQSNNGGSDLCLTKYNSSGTKQWTRIWGSSSSDYGVSVSVDVAGNIYVAGSTEDAFDGQSHNGERDLCLTKFNSNGTKQWTRIWGSSSSDVGSSVSVDVAGNIYVAGSTEDAFDGQSNNGNRDLCLTKFNSNGTKQWTRIWGSDSSDYGNSVCVDNFGNIYVAGHTLGSFDNMYNNGSYDLCLTKFNSNGTKYCSRIWGSTSSDYGYDVKVESNGSIYVVGQTRGTFDGQINNGNYDLCLTKFNNDMTKRVTRILGSSEADTGTSVSFDNKGSVYVIGNIDDSLSLIKFPPVSIIEPINNLYTNSLQINFSAYYNENYINKTEEYISTNTCETWFDYTNNISYPFAGTYYLTAKGKNIDNNFSYTEKTNKLNIIFSEDNKIYKNWSRIWGSSSFESGNSISGDKEGNIYIVGYTGGTFDGESNPGGVYSLCLSKYNNSGVKEWSRIWGSITWDEANAVAIDNDGNIYVAGKTKGTFDGESNSGDFDIFLTKFDKNGTKQWSRIWGSFIFDSANDLCIDNAGNVYVTGYGYFGSAGIFLAKYNSAGEQQWLQSCNLTRIGYGVTADSEGNIYVTGYWEDNKLCLIKYNSAGVEQWNKKWGSSSSDCGKSVAIDNAGNIFVAGWTSGSFDGQSNNGNKDLCLTKFDSNGTKKWTRIWGSAENDESKDVSIDSSGNIYVVGYTKGSFDGETNPSNGVSSLCITKFNNNGAKQTTRIWGSTANDSGNSIYINNLGNIYVAGSTEDSFDGQTNTGDSDLFISQFSHSIVIEKPYNDYSTNILSLSLDVFYNNEIIDPTKEYLSINGGETWFKNKEIVTFPDYGTYYWTAGGIDFSNNLFCAGQSNKLVITQDQVSPAKPSNQLPANGVTGILLTPTLQSSVFFDPNDGDTHSASQWQISENSSFSSTVYDSGETSVNKTSLTVGIGILNYSTKYYWRVKYKDNHNGWSEYSDSTFFDTKDEPQVLPDKPSNQSPADGTTEISLTPVLQSSDFSDSNSGDTHSASQWQISENSTFSSIVYDSGETTASKTSLTVGTGILNYSTKYYWRVKYKDNHEGWSEYSDSTFFDTKDEPQVLPDKPSNQSPADGTTEISLTPVLQSSDFSDSNSGDTHSASQWQIANNSSFSSVVYDSGETTANKTSLTVGTGILNYSTKYYWRVKYKDNHEGWSEYSNATYFDTKDEPQVLPDKPSNQLPVNGATEILITPFLQSSSFSDSNSGDTHSASQWQISENSSFSSIVYDSGETSVNKTSLNIGIGLNYSTKYYWRVKYKDNHNGWSEYSDSTFFDTKDVPQVSPDKPSNQSPADGAIEISLTPVLQSSSFSDSNSGDTHSASQWQIANNSSFSSTVYDSGETTANKTSLTVPTGKLEEAMNYYWHVKHKDNNENWSDYSDETSFETLPEPVGFLIFNFIFLIYCLKRKSI